MTNPPTPSPVIIRPKIRPPRIRPQLVIRAGLLERLNAGWWRKLTLVCAQPGSGKTTLLSHWTGQLAAPAAWLTLDPNDNALERFLVHLAAALDAAAPGAGQGALALLNAPQPIDAQDWINRLVNDVDRCGQRLVLVIDDYHTIHQVAIHEAVRYLLEELPENLHLVIASRSDPPLPLARLRAQDQVTELRGEALRFTVEEAADFLNRVMALNLAQSEVAALDAQTEGWITGLQLAGLALQAQASRQQKPDPARLVKLLSGNARYVLDYLTEEVLRQQPEDIQAFLLETSLLERMSPALCEAVTGRADSAALLKRLDQAHLFILPLDEDDEWFRYHTLFADLLRFQLERSQPERAAELRRKAAAWLEANGYHVEAINQYLSLKDYPAAARLAEEEGHQLLVHGQAALFNGWFNNLPAAVFQARPQLYLVNVFGLISMGQFRLVEDRLQALERLVGPGEMTAAMAGEIAAVRAVTASTSGRFEEAIAQARQALANLPENSHLRCSLFIGLGVSFNTVGRLDESCAAFDEAARLAQINQQYSVVFSALCNKGNIQMSQGRLRQAQATFQGVIAAERALPSRIPLTAMALMGLAGITYEWNALEQALAFAQAAVPLADQWGYVEMRALTRGRCALTLLALGQADQAARMMAQRDAAIQAGNLTGDPSGYLFAQRLLYQLKAGQLKQALQTAGDLPAEPQDGAPDLLSHDIPLALAQVKAWLTQPPRGEARLRALRGFIQRVLAAAERYGQDAYRLEALIALGLVQAALGEPAALEAAEQAVALAEPEGFIRAFVDFGAPAATLLRRIPPSSPRRGYAQRLLAAFDGEAGGPAPVADQSAPALEEPAVRVEPERLYETAAQIETAARIEPAAQIEPAVRIEPAALVEPLSEREIEVLRLVADGLSNQEIAARLVIAQGTVKRHLHNIFEKMAVSTRPQAIAAARRGKMI